MSRIPNQENHVQEYQQDLRNHLRQALHQDMTEGIKIRLDAMKLSQILELLFQAIYTNRGTQFLWSFIMNTFGIVHKPDIYGNVMKWMPPLAWWSGGMRGILEDYSSNLQLVVTRILIMVIHMIQYKNMSIMYLQYIALKTEEMIMQHLLDITFYYILTRRRES